MAAPLRAVFGRALGRSTWRCRRFARPAASRSAATGLCAPCWAKLSLIAPPYCERLGIPFAYDPGPGVLSMQAIADPPAYHRARAAVRYDDVARALVHALKYGDRLDLAPDHGPLDGARRARAPGRADALVPVPLHWRGSGRGASTSRRCWPRRSRRRPACRSPMTALKRVKATAQQVGLSQSERAQNVQGAFACRPTRKAEVAGRRLVLIDDVLTSGATSDACARALLRAGAQSVDLVVFARVVDAVRAPI